LLLSTLNNIDIKAQREQYDNNTNSMSNGQKSSNGTFAGRMDLNLTGLFDLADQSVVQEADLLQL
jgi:hypothetical protein